MPVFVVAVKRSRRCGNHSPCVVRQGLRHSTAALEPLHETETCARGVPLDNTSQHNTKEESRIRKNLSEFFAEFEKEKEKRIIRRSSTPVLIVRRSMSDPQVFVDAEGNRSPIGVEEERNSIINSPTENTGMTVQPGIEKSFKTRRSFSKSVICSVMLKFVAVGCMGKL